MVTLALIGVMAREQGQTVKLAVEAQVLLASRALPAFRLGS